MIEACVGKLCGRPLSAADLETIRRAVLEADPPFCAEVARRVCDALGWHDTLGRPKLMSCRVGLLRLHRASLIGLPAAGCTQRRRTGAGQATRCLAGGATAGWIGRATGRSAPGAGRRQACLIRPPPAVRDLQGSHANPSRTPRPKPCRLGTSLVPTRGRPRLRQSFSNIQSPPCRVGTATMPNLGDRT